MIYGMVYSVTTPSRWKRSWLIGSLAFTLAATSAGIATGALFGLAGGLVPIGFRVGAATLLACVALVVGGCGVIGIYVRLLQYNRETPRRWVQEGQLRWAMKNGVALGIGMTSRIGFSLWYIVPVASFLWGEPVLGAIIYGLYSFVRSAASFPLLIWSHFARDDSDLGSRLLLRKTPVRRFTDGLLIVNALLVIIWVGLP